MHAILLYFLNLFRPYPQKMTVLFLQKEALCLAAFAKGRSETYEIQRYAAAALPPPLSGKKRWDDPGAMAALIREICQHKGIPFKACVIVLSHGDGFLSRNCRKRSGRMPYYGRLSSMSRMKKEPSDQSLKSWGKKDRLFPPSSPRRLLWNWSFLNVLQTCFPAAW